MRGNTYYKITCERLVPALRDHLQRTSQRQNPYLITSHWQQRCLNLYGHIKKDQCRHRIAPSVVETAKHEVEKKTTAINALSGRFFLNV